MAKILLIEPPFTPNHLPIEGLGLAEPLALEMLAGNLRDHDVRIMDMRLDPELEQTLRDFQPDLVGAGCYANGIATTKGVFRRVKQFRPDIMTVAGGHHASLIPADFEDPHIDVVAVGEGEITLRELVIALEGRQDLRQVAGLALKEPGGGMFVTPHRPLLNLDELPLPNRSLTASHRRRYFRGSWRPLVSIATERGCPFRCNFCSMWKVNEGKYRVRRAESVVNEIASLETPYVDFIDDNTLHDVKRAERMHELIKAQGIRKTYKTYARSDTIVSHPDLVEKWRDIGMELTLIGLESFRDADMQAYGKKNTVAKNEEAIRILHHNGVAIVAYLVVNPNFTADDFKAMSEYVAKWRLSHPVFTVLTPLPGTDLFRQVYDQLTTHDYEKFDFFHAVVPTRLPPREFYLNFYELWRRAYSFRSLATKLMSGKATFSLSQAAAFRTFMNRLKGLAESESGA